MSILAKKLKEHAELLGVSNAEVARRVGIEERAYAHYVADRRMPKVATLIQIAERLGTTPNDLLGFEAEFKADEATNALINRFVRAAGHMSAEELELCVVQAEAIAAGRRGKTS